MAHEKLEQSEIFGSQLDLNAILGNKMLARVQAQGSQLKHGSNGLPRASQNAADSGGKLENMKWFGEVIVSSQIKSGQFGVQLRLSGEDDYRRLSARCAICAKNVEAGHVRQAQIQDDDVIVSLFQGFCAITAGGKAIHDVTVSGQEIADRE